MIARKANGEIESAFLKKRGGPRFDKRIMVKLAAAPRYSCRGLMHSLSSKARRRNLGFWEAAGHAAGIGVVSGGGLQFGSNI
jgi:hypothetical protein